MQKLFLPIVSRQFLVLAPNTDLCTWSPTQRHSAWSAWQVTPSSHSMLVREWSCEGIGSVCGVSSLSSLMVVASRASWDTTESSDLQAMSVELFSCTVGTLPWTVARLWKCPFSAKDSNLSESLDGAYSSSGCSVLCALSFLGEPSTITRKDFHGVFLSCIYESNTKQKSQRVSEQVHLLKQWSLFNLILLLPQQNTLSLMAKSFYCHCHCWKTLIIDCAFETLKLCSSFTLGMYSPQRKPEKERPVVFYNHLMEWQLEFLTV